MTRTTGIDAVHYLAKDLQRATAFYREVLGLQPSSGSRWDHGTEFELGDGSTFGIFAMPDGSWYPCGGVMFAVTDIGAAAQRLRDAGVHFFTNGLLEMPGCRVAWCRDPEGNTFAIHARK
ncbi:MAG TPA: VOC family protein [Candidatus Cybelea sp.]|nr:VOC family protein [Candidatus Cybelea sp.]